MNLPLTSSPCGGMICEKKGRGEESFHAMTAVFWLPTTLKLWVMRPFASSFFIFLFFFLISQLILPMFTPSHECDNIEKKGEKGRLYPSF